MIISAGAVECTNSISAEEENPATNILYITLNNLRIMQGILGMKATPLLTLLPGSLRP